MACLAVAASCDFELNRVLIAIDEKINHALHLARCVALAPERIARARPVMGDAGVQRQPQGFLIHVSDHEDVTAFNLGGDANNQPVAVELRRKAGAFLDLGLVAARGKI